MPGNSYGTLFKITTFGESHGVAIGLIIDGCPAGLKIDELFLQNELDRRKPGQSIITTSRREEDKAEILSGVFDGKSTGAPIAILIKNKDQRPEDYSKNKDVYRPSHADFSWDAKFGFRDHRGGGRSSARETACRVAAGAIAKLFLKEYNISTQAYVSQVGKIKLQKGYSELDLSKIESSIIRNPDKESAELMLKAIEQAKAEGDSLGGVVCCVIRGCPAGLGEPVFDKLHAELGKAMLSINAVKGFETGLGFEASEMRGSEHNDAFAAEQGSIHTLTNNSGGIQGGISNGEDIFFRVAFKPVATIAKVQQSVTNSGEPIQLSSIGRHDPCVVARAVPIVEAMAALVIADYLLRRRGDRA
jgi:chorismate synthase